MKIQIPPSTPIPVAAIQSLVADYGCELRLSEGDTYTIQEKRLDACDACGRESRLTEGLCDSCTKTYLSRG